MFNFEDYFGLTYEYPADKVAQKSFIQTTCQYSGSNDYGIINFGPNKNLYISKYLNDKLISNKLYLDRKCFNENNVCSTTGKWTGYFILKDNVMYFERNYSNITAITNQQWFYANLKTGEIGYIYFYSNYVGKDYFHFYNCYYSQKLSQQVFNNQIEIGTNYYQDLMHYDKPSEVITAIFYFLIPVIIVVFLIKVFRKGIH